MFKMSKEIIISLRQATGAGIVEIKKSLEEAGGDKTKAVEILRKRGQAKAVKKQERETHDGIVHAYVHSNDRVGVLVEVACETDFVARNEDFKNFVHHVAMQVAAANPLYLKIEDIPEEVKEKELQLYREEMENAGKLKGKDEEMVKKILEGKLSKYYADACLLEQVSIKDDNMTIREMVDEITAKTGEKIEIKRFVRYAIGE
ncbi:elongation factor Ts [Candidatus Uhrbacteria bacterium RIFCSPLOWO2_12_FULL_46_10]|uniref:Elongation factor Ts n=1 Tax=Candidatus Uhrbacteria bacterium RIFCSPLOWO2_01_FULL_47_25 TaxID=1802402 RepID=A0A1F7UWN8_9BACT|nr:MAG: Elongation factor Ts [Parcubacteria group bacterium GW2011_GWA2_46_9]OGL60187.1 MAG: elongation factor Ts [Candidatus Uhrbacteria bacterium RIFCSPHIGHO2_01_FULL_46_23]OGL69651.1 MAG: elongation factor Ts [Candidatus Uhrbacteria bacterium RIFCSPHIGHO2_02_FULL_47_29]OGL75881.1 MAG: elongation factor Ts [Candidatus Uhrbacteria bacterium RIFCSPHIGHO2_12_FULL_46_13]OGL82712.1 MAG: elongation factor Ts [Candidatus Uhrbacteria bacterium RIFCSPLOWO2_01_FULL_47_25]OGL86823.1 MAG: elongation fac